MVGFFFFLTSRQEERGGQSTVKYWVSGVLFLSLSPQIWCWQNDFWWGDGRKRCQNANNFRSKLWQSSGKPISSAGEFFIFQVCLNIHSWQVGLKQNCEVENIGFRALWINQSPAISRAPPLHTALCWGRLRLQLHNHLHPCPQTTYCWEGTSCSTQRSKIVPWIMPQSSRKTVMLWSNTV